MQKCYPLNTRFVVILIQNLRKTVKKTDGKFFCVSTLLRTISDFHSNSEETQKLIPTITMIQRSLENNDFELCSDSERFQNRCRRYSDIVLNQC